MLEAKSWGTHIRLGTTGGDAAPCSFLWCCCGSVAIYCYYYCTHRASANNKTSVLLVVDVYRWQRWHRKFATLVAAPFGLAVVACCGPRLLPRQLLCCVAWRYGTRYYMPWRVYVRILGWSCVLRSFSFSQVCGFILFVSNHLFCCSALPRCPCLIPHDGFAISFFE